MYKFLKGCLFLSAYLFVQYTAFSLSKLDIEETPYQRLARTQKEYAAAILSKNQNQIGEKSYLLAKRYINFGYLTRGESHLLEALHIKEKLLQYEGVGKIYLIMAGMKAITDTEKAIEYNKLALKNFEKAGTQHGIMGAYRAFGYYYRLIGENKILALKYPWALDSSYYYTKKSLEIGKKVSSPIDLVESYIGMAQIMASRNFEESIKYSNLALEISKKNKFYGQVLDNYILVSKEYIDRSQLHLGKLWLNKATKLLADSTKFNGDIHNLSLKLLELKVFYYQRIGNYRNAFYLQNEMLAIKFHQFETYRDEAMRTIDLSNENGIKNSLLLVRKNEIAIQAQNISFQKRIIFLIVALLVVTLVSAVFFYRLYIRYMNLSLEFEALSQLNEKLVREQHHRTKNNLQSVLSIFTLQTLSVTDPSIIQILTEGQLRLEAMILTHKLLYQGEKLINVNLKEQIPQIVNGVLSGFNINQVNITFNLCDTWLHAEKAIPFAIIINELTTNACKYAFMDIPDPFLYIRCSLDSETIHLSFHNSQDLSKIKSDAEGFGSKLIKHMATRLKGHVIIAKDNGYKFDLYFPLEEDAKYT